MATTSPYSAWLDNANPFAGPVQAQADAIGKLTRIGADTMQQVMKQQQNLFMAAIGRWSEAAGKSQNGPAALLGLPMEAARLNAELTMRNASELAEIARGAQAEMMAVLTARAEQVTADTVHAVEQSVKEGGKLVKRAAEKTAEATGATTEQIALAGKMVE